MARKSRKNQERTPLSRERVLNAAIEMVDESGVEGLSMRKLGAQLGVEAMSLYNYVANKEDILNGIVEMIMAELEIPGTQSDWRQMLRNRANALRQMFMRHPWAIQLVESRTNQGEAAMRYYDTLLGRLRGAGFATSMVVNALFFVDSYLYGFVTQQLSQPYKSDEDFKEAMGQMAQQVPADIYPNIAAMVSDPATWQGLDYDQIFDYGLELVLDALARSLSKDG